jgi:hypothetical protein
MIIRPEFDRIGRVAHCGVEVNHAVERGIRANLGIDFLTDHFVFRRIIVAAPEGRDGGAVNAEILRVCFGGKLRVSGDKRLSEKSK